MVTWLLSRNNCALSSACLKKCSAQNPTRCHPLSLRANNRNPEFLSVAGNVSKQNDVYPHFLLLSQTVRAEPRTELGRIVGDVKTWFPWPNILGFGSFSWALVPLCWQSLVFAAPAPEYSISQCSVLQHIHIYIPFLPVSIIFFPKLCYFEAFEFILIHIFNVSTCCIWFLNFIWVKFANFPFFFCCIISENKKSFLFLEE